MQKHQQERQIAEQTTATDSRVLDTQDEIKLLRDKVESLNLELRYNEQQLQEVEQELKHTNYELCQLSCALAAQRLTLDEAKEIAKNILANGKPSRESLADLLSAIYLSTVKLWDLKPTIKRNPSTRVELDKYSVDSIRFQAKFNELGTRFVGFKAQFARLKAKSDELKVQNKSITSPED